MRRALPPLPHTYLWCLIKQRDRFTFPICCTRMCCVFVTIMSVANSVQRRIVNWKRREKRSWPNLKVLPEGLRRVDMPAEIRTGQVPNRDQKRYRLSELTRKFWDSAVDIEGWLRAGRPRGWSSSPGMAKIFSSSRHPDRFRGFSLLYNGYRGLFSLG
jgi:hypothetical protein